MLKRLIKLANYLDSKGLKEEADAVDHIISFASKTQEELADLWHDEEWVDLFEERDMKTRFDALLEQLREKNQLENFLSYIDSKTELGLREKLHTAEGWSLPFEWNQEMGSDELRDCVAKKWRDKDSDVMGSTSGYGSLTDLSPDEQNEFVKAFKEECLEELEG